MMDWTEKLLELIRDEFQIEAHRPDLASKMCSLGDLEELFHYNLMKESTMYRISSLIHHIENCGATRDRYERAVEILRRHEILPPPLEDAPSDDTENVENPGLKVFHYLAAHKDVPTHKLEIISGILGIVVRNTSMLPPVCAALYKQQSDEPRMQLILAILETKVE